MFALTDGKNYKLLPVAKDYKRIGEGDEGLNTGGMGAISPPPFVDDALMQKVEEKIIKPTVNGLAKKGIVYKGFIYFGFIKVGDEPYVIEYNARMGDPETQVVMPRLTSDLAMLFKAIAEEKLNEVEIEINDEVATTVVLVSGGYPGVYEKGMPISGHNSVSNSVVFHAGTKYEGDTLLTNGGRVMAITSCADTLEEALATSNDNAKRIYFENKFYRKDIGFDVVWLDVRYK